MLELKNVTKKFRKKEVLKGIDYKFEKGIYGILGPNGAGKTTLIRCITQLYPLNDGKILYNNKNIPDDKSYFSNLGYLPQKYGLFRELTVSEMMETMAAIKEVPKDNVKKEIERCIEIVNLSEQYNSKVKNLSGGMIRRLGIAQAILNNPEIIILDEPTAGLDPEERLRFKNIISTLSDSHIVIISTHIVEDVEALCDYIIVMNNGKIIGSGTCTEIQEKAGGKVFELESKNENLLSKPYHIQHRFEKDGRKMIKALSPSIQHSAEITNIKPNVEDGYICLLKKI